MTKLYIDLSRALKEAVVRHGLDPRRALVRVSQGADLPRVLAFGTSRAARSSMVWDKWGVLAQDQRPSAPILHEDVIIASRFVDVERDARCENGTLRHKLSIYAHPFFTLYRDDCFKELLREGDPQNPQNHGRHFLFTIADKRRSVLGALPIMETPAGYALGQWTEATA